MAALIGLSNKRLLGPLPITMGGSSLSSGSLTSIIPIINPGHPNEPLNFQPIAELVGAAMPLAAASQYGMFAPNFGCIRGKWGQTGNPLGNETLGDAKSNDPSLVSIATTQPAGGTPTGHPYAIDILYPGPRPSYTPPVAGMAATNGKMGLYNLWANSGTMYNSLYESYWLRIGDAVSLDFEQHPVGTKINGYWYQGPVITSAGLLIGVIYNHSGGGVALESSWGGNQWGGGNWRFEFSPNPGAFTIINQTLNLTTPLRAGIWQFIETLITTNSAVDVADGGFACWLTPYGAPAPIQTHSKNNIIWRSSTHPSGWLMRHMDAYWGGSGPGNRTRDDHLLIVDHYISGI